MLKRVKAVLPGSVDLRKKDGPSPDSRPKNKLLASLPREDFERLRPHLRTTAVKAKHVFQAANERIREIVFLNGGVASMTTVMHDGTMVETATIGTEGLLGMEAFLGGDIASGETMLQVPDTNVELLAVGIFKAEVERRGALFECTQRYSQGLMTLMMHSTACMALHEVQERCCRWLLMTHDRVQKNDFQLSQEFLAIMLGSTRPTVNVVAGILQKAGLITYKHGRITVLDRKGLEAGACECYATVKAHFDRLGL
jgi:CRP-like cAMP-binding protein